AGTPPGGSVATPLSLAIDPATPSTIYAGSSASVSKSTDGGQTWQVVGNGIPRGAFVRSLVIDPASASVIYGTYTGVDGGWGIVKSGDNGESWKVINSGLPGGPGIGSLAVDPRAPWTVYAGYYVGGLVEGGGLFKSTDGGGSWNEADAGLSSIGVDG